LLINTTSLQQSPLYQEQKNAQSTPKGRTEETEMLIFPKLAWWRKKRDKTKWKKHSSSI